VNITEEAPPGGEYDTDIQKVKEKYRNWRRKIITVVIVWSVLWSVWLFFLADWPVSEDFFLPMIKAYFYNLITLHPFQTLFAFFILAGLVRWIYCMGNKKIHFECPIHNCNTEIFVNEPWECPYCRDDKETVPFFWHTFFDKCKHDHKPPSYQCPTCVKEGREGIFELIPGGRKDKFARLPERLQQNRSVVPFSAAQQPPQQEYIPRDGNFY
jgi:hypothetical protein